MDLDFYIVLKASNVTRKQFPPVLRVISNSNFLLLSFLPLRDAYRSLGLEMQIRPSSFPLNASIDSGVRTLYINKYCYLFIPCLSLTSI